MSRNPDKGHASLRRGRISLPGQIYNVTVTTLERRDVFSDFRAACAAAARIDAAGLLGDAQLLACVLMPDHAHWLIQLGERRSLQSVVRSLKCASALAANRVLRHQGSLWARGFHDHALRQEEDVVTVARYIIANPVRAGLVKRAGEYPFWNAVWIGAR